MFTCIYLKMSLPVMGIFKSEFPILIIIKLIEEINKYINIEKQFLFIKVNIKIEPNFIH